jgi:hypothetical protein
MAGNGAQAADAKVNDRVGNKDDRAVPDRIDNKVDDYL